MKRIIVFMMMLLSLPAFAQVDRSEVRAGNRKFKKDDFKAAEIDYRRAVLKDSTSLAANYNLASSLYRQEDYESAGKALEAVKDQPLPADYHFNAGDVALQKKDYASAVQSFRNALLQNPGDLDAKENYIYAKEMLKNQQEQQNQQQDQQDQQDENQDDQQEQPRPQPQPQEQPQPQPQQSEQPAISRQQAQQMLNAIQAREKETQDKVNKEKAELLKSKQKEKNW